MVYSCEVYSADIYYASVADVCVCVNRLVYW